MFMQRLRKGKYKHWGVDMGSSFHSRKLCKLSVLNLKKILHPLRVLLWPMAWCPFIVLCPRNVFCKENNHDFPWGRRVTGSWLLFIGIPQHGYTKMWKLAVAKKVLKTKDALDFTEKAKSNSLLKNSAWEAHLWHPPPFSFWLPDGPGIC